MTGPPKVTLQHLLSRPLHHREEQLVRANRINFPGHEETLHKHLQRLGLIGLARYLVWVPFDSFNYVSHVEVRGGGGTSVVYHGIMRWLPLNFAFVRDADDMRTSEYDDLRIAGTEFETQPEELNPPQYEDLAPPEYPICFKNEGIRRDYVLREFDASMVDEVILTTYLSYYHPHTRRDTTMLLVGLSWNEETDKYVMISERANDGSLDDHMFDIPDYRWETIIRCIHEIADSLAEIHRAGIIHRNLHPGNVVMHRGVPYLIDTGLAAHVVRSKGKQGVYGRLAYLPPEVFEGKPYTQSSDVYCLGTIFWQLITGVPPRGIAGSLYRNSREERIPGLLPDIQSIIFDCWNPDPRGRPTAEAVRERILLAYQKRPALFSAMTRNFIKDRREAHLDQLERDLFDITKADAAWADAWARSDDIDLEKAYRKLVAHAWSKSDFFTTFELKKLHRLHAVAMKDDVISFGPSPSPSTSWTPVLKSMFGFFKGPNSP